MRVLPQSSGIELRIRKADPPGPRPGAEARQPLATDNPEVLVVDLQVKADRIEPDNVCGYGTT
jgi:hypothetical protein